jgi:hypothetical protein
MLAKDGFLYILVVLLLLLLLQFGGLGCALSHGFFVERDLRGCSLDAFYLHSSIYRN